MMSLFNKSGGKADAMQALAWHPNFRNAEQLPDTKTVRTRFFINVVAVTTVVALLLFAVLRETRLAALAEDLDGVEADIAAATAPSDKAIADYKLFQAEEKRFKDAYSLVSNSFRISTFITHLGSALPIGVKIRRVEFRGLGQVINVSGSVRGLDAAASDVASEFVKTLQVDPVFTEHFSAITLTNLGRNVAEGNMSFELVFAFKTAPKAPAKKGRK